MVSAAVEGEAAVEVGLAALEEEGEVVGMIVAGVVVAVVVVGGGMIAVVELVEGQGVEVGVEVGEVGILEIPYSQGLSIFSQYIYL